MSLIVDDAGDILGGRVGDQAQQQSGDDGDEGNAIPATALASVGTST